MSDHISITTFTVHTQNSTCGVATPTIPALALHSCGSITGRGFNLGAG
jgi:hypothetical protein